MSQWTGNDANDGEEKALKQSASFMILPDDLVSDIDRAMAYLRNHQAKQRIRLRLKQYAQDSEYRLGPSPTAPPA